MRSRKRLFLAAAVVTFALAILSVAIFVWAILADTDISRYALVVAVLLLTVLTSATLAGCVQLYRRRGRRQATRIANLERELSRVNERLKMQSSVASQTRGDIEALEQQSHHIGSLLQRDVTDAFIGISHETQVALRSVLSLRQATARLQAALSDKRPLDAVAVIHAWPESAASLSLTEARRLVSSLRRLGFLSAALSLMQRVADLGRKMDDVRAAERFAQELAMYKGVIDIQSEPPVTGCRDATNVVLHLVGKGIGDVQTGYTLRTQRLVKAQLGAGILPVVAVQAGINGRTVEMLDQYTRDGVIYFNLAGPMRGVAPWDEWLQANVDSLRDLVRRTQPAVIHVHSDFINALIAYPVADEFEIPVVNETRGFWEESWLFRTATLSGWRTREEIESSTGLPEMYSLRREREAEMRSRADAVVTLSRGMKAHIETTAQQLNHPLPRIWIAPNAVDVQDFAPGKGDPSLLEQYGVAEDTLVIGYVSSLVEYEGIDTLIRGFAELCGAIESIDNAKSSAEAGVEERAADLLGPLILQLHPTVNAERRAALADRLIEAALPLAGARLELLIVGDGPVRGSLDSLVAALGLANVTFTGAVPHGQIRDFYLSIDLFVIPRKPGSVTDLVTPLKPFEALSTGRACLFSDVGALQEIAEDSGSVTTFRAGNHSDLARQAAALLADPERRADMGRRSSEWVATHRTWESNASTYLDIYRSTAEDFEVGPVDTAQLLGTVERHQLESLVAAWGEQGAPRLQGWYLIAMAKASAAEIVELGWERKGHPRLPIRAGMDWAAAGKTNRSWGFHLHAWEFMDPVLAEYSKSGDGKWRDWLVNIAVDWWEYVGEHDDDRAMAWYDMALSLRMPRLSRLVVLLARAGEIELVERLIPSLTENIRRLALDEAYTNRNNHGFYAAAAGLDAARIVPGVPGVERLRELSQARMREMVDLQFATDGGHLEHSPDYHRMLLASFEGVLNDGLTEDPRIAERIRAAAEVMGWMVQPDGYIVQFGDTPRKFMAGLGRTSISPHTNFIFSDGHSGQPHDHELFVLPESGYAFVRSPQPQNANERIRSSYLAFQAGFHSRAHKHADDLTFVWFDRGREILVDSGRFGYVDLLPPDSPDRLKGFFYSAPERQYVESTKAHNTVEVDGTDIERRTRKPYGSALTTCKQDGDVFRLSGRVNHARYLHDRTLELLPAKKLIIQDTIESDESEAEAIAWFNLNGDAEVEVREGHLHVKFDDATRLRVVSTGSLIDPVRGQMSPLRGWRSETDGQLEPSWNFGFRFDPVKSATVRTEFEFLDT